MASTSFFTLLVIGVSFLPVLALEAEEGRLFKPLAYTKTLAMVVAAVLAITLDPALRMLLTRVDPYDFKPAWLCRLVNRIWVGKIRQEESHPISRFLIWIYAPVAAWALRRKWWVIAGALVMIIATVPVFLGLGSEFMPPLEEGSLMYMPTTMPGISITEANNLLQITDRIIGSFPEVDTVLGKIGRVESALDPAPAAMIETYIMLKPRDLWREGMTERTIWDEINAVATLPGITPASPLQPIEGRVVMLQSGMRAPMGVKVKGPSLEAIEQVVDRPHRSVRLVDHPAGDAPHDVDVGLVDERLGEYRDRTDRGLQLVGDVRDELALQLVQSSLLAGGVEEEGHAEQDEERDDGPQNLDPGIVVEGRGLVPAPATRSRPCPHVCVCEPEPKTRPAC